MLNKLQIVSVKAAEVFAANYTVKPKFMHRVDQSKPFWFKLYQTEPNLTITNQVEQKSTNLYQN